MTCNPATARRHIDSRSYGEKYATGSTVATHQAQCVLNATGDNNTPAQAKRPKLRRMIGNGTCIEEIIYIKKNVRSGFCTPTSSPKILLLFRRMKAGMELAFVYRHLVFPSTGRRRKSWFLCELEYLDVQENPPTWNSWRSLCTWVLWSVIKAVIERFGDARKCQKWQWVRQPEFGRAEVSIPLSMDIDYIYIYI